MEYGFNTDDVKLDAPGLPPGQYTCMITAETREPTKAGDNEFLKVTFQCVEGEYKGKSIIQRFNIWNSNPVAANIAKQDIKRIAEATGKPANDENPLKGRVLDIIVGFQKGSDVYTEIKKYLHG